MSHPHATWTIEFQRFTMTAGTSTRQGCDMRHQTIPIDRTSRDLAEIVEEIMDNLRPWTCPESEVEAGIERALEALHELNPLEESLFDRSGIKKSAKDFGAAIAEVANSLRRVHPTVAWRLFGMQPDLLFDQIYERSVEEITQAHIDRMVHFHDELTRLRIECEELVRNPGGFDPNKDVAKGNAAWGALQLMRDFSKRSPSGTAERPFRTISSLIYEAMSGNREADLKRACDEVIRWKRFRASS
jgi:hypothetical protein